MPSVPRSRRTPHADADARIRELHALADDRESQTAQALKLIEKSRHLELIRVQSVGAGRAIMQRVARSTNPAVWVPGEHMLEPRQESSPVAQR